MYVREWLERMSAVTGAGRKISRVLRECGFVRARRDDFASLAGRWKVPRTEQYY